MVKIQIKYENESDKDRIVKILSDSTKIKKISNGNNQGKYSKIYVDIE